MAAEGSVASAAAIQAAAGGGSLHRDFIGPVAPPDSDSSGSTSADTRGSSETPATSADGTDDTSCEGTDATSFKGTDATSQTSGTHVPVPTLGIKYLPPILKYPLPSKPEVPFPTTTELKAFLPNFEHGDLHDPTSKGGVQDPNQQKKAKEGTFVYEPERLNQEHIDWLRKPGNIDYYLKTQFPEVHTIMAARLSQRQDSNAADTTTTPTVTSHSGTHGYGAVPTTTSYPSAPNSTTTTAAAAQYTGNMNPYDASYYGNYYGTQYGTQPAAQYDPAYNSTYYDAQSANAYGTSYNPAHYDNSHYAAAQPAYPQQYQPTPPAIQNPFAPPATTGSTQGNTTTGNDPNEEAAIAEWKAQYDTPYEQERKKKAAKHGMTAGNPYYNSVTAGTVPVDNTERNVSTPKAENQPAMTVKRQGGGQQWEDSSLVEWDGTHYRIFVGNLAGEVTDESLFKTFAPYNPSKARVIRERGSSKSKGFGFVSFADHEDGHQAHRNMNGQYIGSRPCKIDRAKTDVTPTVSAKGQTGKKTRNTTSPASGSGAGAVSGSKTATDPLRAHTGAHVAKPDKNVPRKFIG